MCGSSPLEWGMNAAVRCIQADYVWVCMVYSNGYDGHHCCYRATSTTSLFPLAPPQC